MTSEKLSCAIQLIKSGNKLAALSLLKEVVKDEPNNENAWLCLYSCVDNVDQKKYCIQQALRINPKNQNAHAALLQLENQVPLSSPKSIESQGPPPPVYSQTQQIPNKQGFQKSKKSKPHVGLLQLGGIAFLLLVLVGIVIFGGGWVFKGLAYPDKFAPALVSTQIGSTSTPANVIQPSLTPMQPLVSLSTLRPSITPYPTNTLFVLFTWTPTNSPPTQTPTQAPFQSPTQSSKSIKLPKGAGGNGSDSPPADSPPADSPPSDTLPYESPYDIIPVNTKPPKANITITCAVYPPVIEMARDTTLLVSAQMYIDGNAANTVALSADWKDSLGRDFHCTSSSDSCQGQSGHLTSNASSTIKISAQTSDGSRRNCQTIYRTY